MASSRPAPADRPATVDALMQLVTRELDHDQHSIAT